MRTHTRLLIAICLAAAPSAAAPCLADPAPNSGMPSKEQIAALNAQIAKMYPHGRDAKGDAALKRLHQLLLSAKSIQYTCAITSMRLEKPPVEHMVAKMSYQSPNLVAMDLTQRGAEQIKIVYRNTGGYAVDVPKYCSVKLAPNADRLALSEAIGQTTVVFPSQGAPNNVDIPVNLALKSVHVFTTSWVLGTRSTRDLMRDGRAVTEIKQTWSPNAYTTIEVLTVDRKTGLPVSIVERATKGGVVQSSWKATFTQFLTSNKPLPASTFQYTPPADMNQFDNVSDYLKAPSPKY